MDAHVVLGAIRMRLGDHSAGLSASLATAVSITPGRLGHGRGLTKLGVLRYT